MRRSAKAKAAAEESGPEFAVLLRFQKARAEDVRSAFGGMGVMRISPVPGGQGLVFFRLDLPSRFARIVFGFGFEEALEGGAGQFAGVPGVGGLQLRVSAGARRDR